MNQKQIEREAEEALRLLDRTDLEGRNLTPEEEAQVGHAIGAAREARDQKRALNALDPGGAPGRASQGNFTSGPPGSRFIESHGYKSISDPASRPSRWSSGPVEVSSTPLSTKGTLTLTDGGGPGGGLVPPHYEAGVVSKLFQPLGVADLFGQSTINASQVRYAVEGTATSGAAGVAEGATKPESELAYSEVIEPVKKIATSLVVSDEMLEDAASIEAYLNERLSLFVQTEEERQLLRGGGTNELVGLFSRGINTYGRGTVEDNSVALLRAANGVRGSAFLEPDGVILHPDNWLTTRLLTDSTGQFLGGGPFQGQYGAAGQVASSQFSATPLWG